MVSEWIGVDERGEMHSGKREKHLDNPRSFGFEPSLSHKVEPSETETEHSHTVAVFFFFDLFSPLFIDLVFPSRVQTLHRG